ncbi:hypothetical protein F5884DRAFT_76107 [Xylogone sp. PMI_703]|nr:hypothetical protein F5884DRAFT_76107 [Xylogone sp. PMI_703]
MNTFRGVTRTLRFNPKLVSYKVRTMSSEAPAKYEWLVIIPDQKDARERRLAVRPQHFKDLQPDLDSGFYRMGGALLEEVPKDDNLAFQGSTVVAWAATKEEVLERLKNDVYAKNNVWDFSKIQIYPFKCAFRDAL